MEDIQDKIRKLLAKANGTESEHEAMLFAAKAAELAQRHNLDLQDCVAAGQAQEEPVVKVAMRDVNTNGWRLVLYSAVCELYFSSYYTSTVVETSKTGKYVQRKVVYFYGKKHNVEIAMSMCVYLVKTTLRLAKQSYADRYSILHFEKSCGFRLATRIREMTKAAQSPAIQDSTGSGLPALYATEAQLLEVFVADMGLGKPRKTVIRTGSAASAAGRAAADRVNLGGQIGVRANNRMLS